MPKKILIVDDDPDILEGLSDRLGLDGFDILNAKNGKEALKAIQNQSPDLTLLDLFLPDIQGLEILQTLRQAQETQPPDENNPPQVQAEIRPPVIVMTAHGSIEKAVEAMKIGAFDFLPKPFDLDHLTLVIDKALRRTSLERKVENLQAEVDSPYATIIGEDEKIQDLKTLAGRAAQSQATVLLQGETGTGKELFARTIHRSSPRRTEPFMAINCASLPDTLLENELFGHERGAFTGANQLHVGKIEAAQGGTVFLDEIGDLPLPLQGRLLRVLQDHQFQRVGGTKNIEVDVRFIAATHRDLEEWVKKGDFREDLFFRLNILTFELPPLRNRPSDIHKLANFFVERHCREAKKSKMKITDDAQAQLTGYAWPGNVRELDNVLARAVILTSGNEITTEFLNLKSTSPETMVSPTPVLPQTSYHEAMEAYSRQLIVSALREAEGNKTRAAELLKLQRTYFARLMKQRDIQ